MTGSIIKKILVKTLLNYIVTNLLIINKDENAHRFALSAIRGEFLEIERERERERLTNNNQNLNHRYIPLREVKRAN